MTNWQTKKIGDVTTLLKDGTHGTHNDVNDGIPLLSAKDIVGGKVSLPHDARQISEDDFNSIHKRYKLQDGDVLLTIVGSLGRVARVINYSDNYTFQRSVAILRFNDEIDSKYAYYVFTEGSFQKELLKRESKGAQGGVYLGDIAKIKIQIPEKPEQERIVRVLEVWDEYIEKLEQKIALKEQMKKGLMQQLLTGKRRLPGFNSEWKCYSMKELGGTYSGLSGKSKDDFGSGEPFITYMNIYKNPVLSTKDMPLVNIEEDERQSVAQYGDIFFTTSSETPEEVGISATLLEKVDRSIYLNSFCFGYRMHDLEVLMPEFAVYYFRSNEFRKKMARLAQGASRYNLSKKYFMDTKIFIPEKNEQLAIARILTL